MESISRIMLTEGAETGPYRGIWLWVAIALLGLLVVALIVLVERRSRERVDVWRRVQSANGWQSTGGEPFKDEFKGISGNHGGHDLQLFMERGGAVGDDPIWLSIAGPSFPSGHRIRVGMRPSESDLQAAIDAARRLIDDRNS